VRTIRRPELGHLTVGADADIAAWRVLEGDFGFRDVEGGGFHGKQRLLCELTVRAGRLVWDWNARSATDYRKLPPDYGVRPGGPEVIVVPK
jgi:dihydroorotase